MDFMAGLHGLPLERIAGVELDMGLALLEGALSGLQALFEGCITRTPAVGWRAHLEHLGALGRDLDEMPSYLPLLEGAEFVEGPALLEGDEPIMGSAMQGGVVLGELPTIEIDALKGVEPLDSSLVTRLQLRQRYLIFVLVRYSVLVQYSDLVQHSTQHMYAPDFDHDKKAFRIAFIFRGKERDFRRHSPGIPDVAASL
jgi:hypothetical protein